MISNLLFDNLSFNSLIIEDCQKTALEHKTIKNKTKVIKKNFDFLILTNINIFHYYKLPQQRGVPKTKKASYNKRFFISTN